MDEKAKRTGLIVVAIVATVAAGFGIMRFVRGDQPQVVSKEKSPFPTSRRQAEMDNQKKERVNVTR